MTIAEIQQEILRMKKEQDICILAHAYQGQEILEVADYTGDSYGLSVQASKRDCSGVIMCGVRFMAETCKILSPKKRVWLANPVAGCPMAEQLDLEGLRELKAQYPDYAVVAYINTTSELKTECDVCVTSSSAVEICKKLGLEPMIWSDMYITANTGGGYYDVADDTDCSDWEKPDPELGLVYWDYYNPDQKIYEKMIRVHQQLSNKVIFAGGSWIWNGISPNYSKTFTCTRAGLAACKKYHLPEVFCTAWMDNGAETPVDAVLPGLVLFAHLGFHEDFDEKALAEEFHDVTGAGLNDFLELDALDSLFQNGQPNLDTDNPSKYLLYQDPLLGIFDRHIEDLDLDTERYYQDLADRLEICRKHAPAYDTLFAFYRSLASTLAGKADLGVRLKKAYDTHDLSTLEIICEEVIPGIINDLSTTRLLREHLWMQDAKPFGYELVDIKLSGVIARLTSTRYRLRYYIDGRVKRLEELEADRLPYFLPGTPKRENLWHRIISGADLMDTI